LPNETREGDRFYSDRGLVPPAERTGAGYRVYDERALAQLVALQLEAVEAQLRVLRVRRAVLMAVASGEPDGQELTTMTRLAHISDDERKRMIEEFLDEVLGGLEIDPGLEARLRGGLPELPDEPTPEQVEAWVELAELVRDPDFRARIRQMAEAGAAERERGEAPDGEAMHAAAALVAERGGAALEAGIEPGSEEAEAIVEEILTSFGGRSTAPSSPIASSRAPISAPSATGSSSRSSTAGRRFRRRCRPGAGRSMRCVRGRRRSPVRDYRSRTNERYGGAYPLRCRLAARGR
jgi:DNA-binding transcriptional MerR regulator